jgi:hypothetical protein
MLVKTEDIGAIVKMMLKVKFSLCLTNLALRHEGVWGSGFIDQNFFLPRHYLEVSGQLHASAALPRGKSPRYP